MSKKLEGKIAVITGGTEWEIGSHFPLASCTQCCTQDSGDVPRVLHALRRRTAESVGDTDVSLLL